MFRLTSRLLLAIFVVVAGQSLVWGKKIALVLSRSWVPYQEAELGFKSQLSTNIQTFNMEGNLEKGQQIMSAIKPGAYDLLVCIGSEALGAAEKYLPAPIPVVYTMVLDRHQLTGKKFGGVVMQISLKDQFDRMLKLLPKVQKIGVIYNPAYSQQTINQARSLVKKYNLQLIPIAVDKANQVPMALDKLKTGKVDAIWSVVDTTMTQPQVMKQVIDFTLGAKIPFIGLSIYQVKAGALMAFSMDFRDVGEQSAQLADKMLKSKATTGIETPRVVVTYINPLTQKKLGLNITTQMAGVQYVQ